MKKLHHKHYVIVVDQFIGPDYHARILSSMIDIYTVHSASVKSVFLSEFNHI
jgi:hypothetical protein